MPLITRRVLHFLGLPFAAERQDSILEFPGQHLGGMTLRTCELPFLYHYYNSLLTLVDRKTVKCDVNYGSEAFGRVAPPLLNMVRQSFGLAAFGNGLAVLRVCLHRGPDRVS